MLRTIGIGLITLSACFLLSSCGGDKAAAPTGPAAKKNGNLNDAQFTMTRSQINYVNKQSISALKQVYSLVSTIGGVAPPRGEDQNSAASADSIFMGYHPASGYWLYAFDFSYVVGTDSVTSVILDSLQFLHGTTPVQYPDSLLLTGVNLNYRYLIDYKSGDSLAYAMSVSMTGAPGEIAGHGDVVANGSGYFRGRLTVTAGNESCVYNYNFASGYTNLSLNLDSVFAQGGCPFGGTLSQEGSFSLACTGSTNLTYAGEWTADLTYSSSGIAYSYENATTTWLGTATCGQLVSPEVPEPFDNVRFVK